ncbi:RING-H2 finger protein ATL8-like protein [Tanacetum coccineum]
MTRFRRILSGLHSLTVPAASPPQPTPDYDPVYFNSEFILFIGLVIIVVFLLCLIGLNAASRCTWIKCFSQTEVVTASASNRFDHFSLPAAKLLRNIPKVTYSAETMAEKFSDDCAICLSEFVAGDEVRLLPPCGHCFHVECVDRWIGLHFTCPSCRQMLLKTMIRCNIFDDEVAVA